MNIVQVLGIIIAFDEEDLTTKVIEYILGMVESEVKYDSDSEVCRS